MRATVMHTPRPRTPHPAPARGGRPVRPLLAAAVLAAAVLTAGCGHHHYEGDIVVDNRTDLTTNEMLMTLRIARFGQPFSNDLLGGPLPVLSSRYVGTFREDYYDAEGDLELGMVIEWFDEFVGDESTTILEVR